MKKLPTFLCRFPLVEFVFYRVIHVVDIFRGFKPQAPVQALPVVNPYGLFCELACEFYVFYRVFQTEFIFQDSVYPFGHRVFIRIVLLCCAQNKIVFPGKIREFRASILDPPVRVVDNAFVFELQVFNGHPQCVYDQGSFHIIIQCSAH